MESRQQRRHKKKQLAKAWSKRSCGDCTACCTVLGVEELDKKSYQRCEHVCAKGCAIYKDRPTTCRTYACAWKAGMVPDEFYPLKMGVVFDTTHPLKIYTAREYIPGALKTRQVKEAIEFIANQAVIIVTYNEHDRKVLGPPDMVRAFMREAAQYLGLDPLKAMDKNILDTRSA